MLIGTTLIKEIVRNSTSDCAFAKPASSMLKCGKLLLRNAVGRGGASTKLDRSCCRQKRDVTRQAWWWVPQPHSQPITADSALKLQLP